ncbi:hypothetical protein HDV06_001209 [Boothiomyces sp. JEL0866]|nr:hypothetical protein HDV06_001209 [Boothiomyces sp. JEL0866]
MATVTLNYDQLESTSESATVLGMTIAIIFRPFVKKLVSYQSLKTASAVAKTYHYRILGLALLTMLKALAEVFYVLAKGVKSIQGATSVLSSYNTFVFLDIVQQWWVLFEILYRAQSMISILKRKFWWVFAPISLVFVLKFARMFSYSIAYSQNNGSISTDMNNLIQTYFINLPTWIILIFELVIEVGFFYVLSTKIEIASESSTETNKYLLVCSGCEVLLLIVYLADSAYIMATNKAEYLSYYSHLCYGYMIADLLEFGGNLKDLLNRGDKSTKKVSVKATEQLTGQ